MDWTVVYDAVDRIDKHDPFPVEAILAAERRVRTWAAEGLTPPSSVYGHDGSVWFEWHMPGEVIVRVEVTEKDAEAMTTFPAGVRREAVFQDI